MELVKTNENGIELNKNFVKEYKEFQKIKLEMDLKEKQFKEELKSAMESIGKEKLILDGFCATIKAPYERSSIDTAKLKKELPDIAEEYTKKTTVASSISIAIE